MNIICIDYSITKNQDLKLICDKYSLIFEEILEKRTKYNLHKIFIDLDSHKLFAYTFNSDKQKVHFTDVVDSVFLSIPNCVVEIDSNISIELDVDKILDKIHKYGMSSLVKEEREFLDQFSKL